MWQETAAVDLKELARLREAIYEAEIGKDIIARPYHPTIEPCPNPDSLPFDTLGAESRGEPVDPDEYPVGTWFYWGADKVSVRLAGQSRLCRVEERRADTE